MPIDVQWDNEAKTIIRYTFPRIWTVEEFFAVFPLADEMMRASQTHVIGIIIDDRAEQIPPQGALNAFRQTVRKGKLPMVFVGASRTSQMMMEMLQKAYHGERKLYYVNTLQEARTILEELAAEANPPQET